MATAGRRMVRSESDTFTTSKSKSDGMRPSHATRDLTDDPVHPSHSNAGGDGPPPTSGGGGGDTASFAGDPTASAASLVSQQIGELSRSQSLAILRARARRRRKPTAADKGRASEHLFGATDPTAGTRGLSESRSAYLYSNLQKGVVLRRSIDTEFAGMSNYAAATVRRDNTLIDGKPAGVAKPTFAQSSRFPPTPMNLFSPGPKYSRRDHVEQEGEAFSFGGGDGKRDTFVLGTLVNGLIYPARQDDMNSDVGPANYNTTDAALKLRPQDPSVAWGRSRSRRFPPPRELRMAGPGPKYFPQNDVIGTGTHVSFGPRPEPQPVEAVAVVERKLAPTDGADSDDDANDAAAEAKAKSQQKKAKPKKIVPPGTRRGGHLVVTTRKGEGDERKREEVLMMSSTWAQRLPLRQYTGKKFVKSFAGLESPGPVYNPPCDNWKLKVEPPSYRPRLRRWH